MFNILWREFHFSPAALQAARQYQAESGLPKLEIEPDADQPRSSNLQGKIDSPTPWGGVLLGILPFLLFGGAYLLVAAYELGWPIGVSPGLARTAPLIVYGILSMALILCWIAGFPRWSLSYLGMAIYFGYDFSHAQIYGVRYGLQGWLPLVSGLVVGLLVSQSFHPLTRLFLSLWNDWTRLSFGIYAYLVPLMTIIFFDNDWGRLDFYGLIFDTLLLSVGAVAFLRSLTSLKSAVSLQAVMVIMLVRGVLMGGWLGGIEGIGSLNLPGLAIVIVIWGGLMFIPGLLALLRRGLGVDRFVGEL